MRGRIITIAAALAVLTLTWSSTVIAFSRCAFGCEMSEREEADKPSCPLCAHRAEPPTDRASIDAAVDRSCCGKEFKTSQVGLIDKEPAAAPAPTLALTEAPVVKTVPRAMATAPFRARPPPDPRSLSDRRTVVLLL